MQGSAEAGRGREAAGGVSCMHSPCALCAHRCRGCRALVIAAPPRRTSPQSRGADRRRRAARGRCTCRSAAASRHSLCGHASTPRERGPPLGSTRRPLSALGRTRPRRPLPGSCPGAGGTRTCAQRPGAGSRACTASQGMHWPQGQAPTARRIAPGARVRPGCLLG